MSMVVRTRRSSTSASSSSIDSGTTPDTSFLSTYSSYHEKCPPSPLLEIEVHFRWLTNATRAGLDEDAVLEAKKNVERFDPLCNTLDVQRQKIRDHYASLLSEDDWMTIEREYCRLYGIESIIRATQELHGRYKEDLSIIDREVYGLYETLKARDRLESEQAYTLEDRLRRPPSPPDEAHSDLSSSARIAIIRAMQKLLEHLTDSVSTGYPSARTAHGLRSAGLRGRANELMHILEATVPLQYEGVTLHTTEVQEVLGCDRITQRFYNAWTTSKKGQEITNKISSGLAIMMRPLALYYDGQKRTLRMLLRDVPGLGRDYDTLRKDDVNPRHFIHSPNLTREGKTEILAILDNLESIAPGLLILLRPELLQIALNHEYNILASTSALIDPSSIEEEERKRFVSNLCAQGTYSAAYKENSVELFKILCGEGHGPWRKSMHAKSLGELNAMAVSSFRGTKPQPLDRGDHMVMMVDRGDGSRTWRLVWFPEVEQSFGWPDTESTLAPSISSDSDSEVES